MMDVKKTLQLVRSNLNSFYYDSTSLNKLFIVRMHVDNYGFLLYRNTVESMYMNMYLCGDVSANNITYKFNDNSTEVSLEPYSNFVIIPNEDAGTDEWFNFNIQNSSLVKENFYPELNGLGDLLTNEYNRVFMKMLDDKGL